MIDYAQHWRTILKDDEKHQVDIVASLHEDAINQFLTKHFEIDSTLPVIERKYNQVFERVFQTFGDPRKFKITLKLTQPIKVKLPPFADVHLSPSFEKKTGWQAIGPVIDSPELKAMNKDGENLIEVVASGVTITMEWPKLNGALPPWTFTIPPFEVIAQAELQLNQEGQDFFATIIPKFILFDIPRNNLLTNMPQSGIEEASKEMKLLVADCEEKFVDLFIIAANIAAFEQTPKLVTSIKLPVPVIQDRPVQPAAFDISNNIMSVGFGIDKVVLDKLNTEILNTKVQELDFMLKKDVEENGGLLNMSFKNTAGKKIITPNQLIPRLDEEKKQYFTNTNAFIEEQQLYLKNLEAENKADERVAGALIASEGYAIGINEYFFDVIVNSALPQPKHRCEKDVEIGLVKGYICHWSSFTNPDIAISNSAALTGSVDINVGGSIHACVKKFWDCSWKWACSKLALALVGRPQIKLKVLSADGIRVLAQLSGDLRIASNLPFPFNKIVEVLSGLVIQFIIAFINLLAVLLSFYVLKPKIDVEDLHISLGLKNFSSFYFERITNPSQIAAKNRFICFKTNLTISRM